MADDFVIRIAETFEESESFGGGMFGVGDLTLEGDGGAGAGSSCSLEDAPALHGMLLVLAKLVIKVCERLAPLLLRCAIEKLAAIIAHGRLMAVGGDRLEVASEDFFSILLRLRQAATGKNHRGGQNCDADRFMPAIYIRRTCHTNMYRNPAKWA